MEDIETLTKKAHTYDIAGNTEDALATYNDAFNVLIERAGVYARAQMADVTDLAVLRTMTPLLFQYSTDYLKQDLSAATILTAMGVLFERDGELENAKQKFEEALVYIPDTVVFEEPLERLEAVTARLATSIVNEEGLQ